MVPPDEGERAPLVPYAEEHDIDLVAWSPLARGRVLDRPEVRTVARRRDASPAQVALAWLLEAGFAVVVKSNSRAHLRDNLGALDVELTAADVDLVGSVERRERLFDREDAAWH